jgi:predicted AAA+ superfamily ATPase
MPALPRIGVLAAHSPLGYNCPSFPWPLFPGGSAFAASSSVSRTRLDETEVVRQLLEEAELSRDQLPYTDEFARLKREFETRLRRRVTESEFWRLLVRVGKRGGLARPKSEIQKVPAPKLTTEEQLEMLRLLLDGIGTRDQLPYTERFDILHRRFNRLIRANLDQREFWRVLSRVGKRSRKPKPLFDAGTLTGLHEELVQLLERQNPWWGATPARRTERFRRWAFAEVIDRLERGLVPVVAIRGSRRVGKTTIQEQLIEELLKLRHVNPARIFRVEFDEVPLLGSFQHPILALVNWFEKNVLRDSLNAYAQRGEPVYLFFDEVQNLKTWAPELKSLVDHADVKTLITGSSALRIADGQDSLAGRLSMIELGPLRLGEIVGVRQIGALPPFHPSADIEDWTRKSFWLDLAAYASPHGKILKKAFDAFSDVGGYPECHKREAKKARGQLIDDIRRFVVDRTLTHDLKAGPGGTTRDERVLEETFRRVCRYTGQPVRRARIGEEVSQVLASGVHDKSVHDAIRFWANALLLHEIPPLEALTRRQAHPSKLCICDHFVREAWLQERVPITPRELAHANQAVATLAGHIIESDIGYYLKGICGLDVSWFPERNGEPEVDFVLTLGLQRIPIEVKYCRSRPDAGDLAGLRSFCSQAKYNAPFGLLITRELSGAIDGNIVALPAYALLSVR